MASNLQKTQLHNPACENDIAYSTVYTIDAYICIQMFPCTRYTWLVATTNTHTCIDIHFTVDSRPTLRTCTVVATVKVETYSFILAWITITFIDILFTSEPSVSRRTGARKGQLVVDDNTSTSCTMLTSVSCTGLCAEGNIRLSME